MKDLFAAPLETPHGVFLVIFNEVGIYGLEFPGSDQERSYPEKPLPYPGLTEDFNRFLQGERVDWSPYPLNMQGYPPFTRRVLEAIKEIPHGETWSYRETALKAGSPRGWRATGQALGSNRHPVLIPCHRVVRSDGTLGGFSAPAGWKERLLALEGALK